MAHLNVRNLPATTSIDPYKKIGMLTPPTNSTLEPVCSRMLGNLPEAVCLFSRIPTTAIRKIQGEDFFAPMLQASELLAYAEVDVIAWNGTTGCWLGFDVDRELCRRITAQTGIPSTTSMLAQLEAFKTNNVKKIHVIAPYQRAHMERMIEEYTKSGIEVVNAEACGYDDAKSMRNASDELITSMLEAVVTARADGISVVCTAFPLIHKIAFYEKKYNYTIYDTINVMLWHSLKMIGIDTRKVTGWGQLFRS